MSAPPVLEFLLAKHTIAPIILLAINIFFLVLAAVGLVLLIKVALRAITALDIYIKQNNEKT